MKARISKRFEALTKQATGDAADDKPGKASNKRRPSVLGNRQASVEAAASGRVRTVKVFGHDPKRIRAWAGHNRDYELLSAQRCGDLIDGFRRAGQQFPAIVRTVSDSPDYDYEYICGARRHWTANYLERDLLVEVRSLEDRDAFLLQDIENRDREDISDYERAVDYHKALPVYFAGKKSHMAEQLQIDQGNFTRMLALAELPEEIVAAYGDIRDLLVHHGTMYTKWLKEPETKKQVLAAAKKLKGQGATGKQVIAALRQATTAKRQRAPATQRATTWGLLSVQTSRAGECSINFPRPDDTQSIEALRKSFNALLDEMAKDNEREKADSQNSATNSKQGVPVA